MSVDKEVLRNMEDHEQTCRRISAAKGCLYPPEAETLYWLIDDLREQLSEVKESFEACYSRAARIDKLATELSLETDNLACAGRGGGEANMTINRVKKIKEKLDEIRPDTK